jgi:hypothetical protein
MIQNVFMNYRILNLSAEKEFTYKGQKFCIKKVRLFEKYLKQNQSFELPMLFDEHDEPWILGNNVIEKLHKMFKDDNDDYWSLRETSRHVNKTHQNLSSIKISKDELNKNELCFMITVSYIWVNNVCEGACNLAGIFKKLDLLIKQLSTYSGGTIQLTDFLTCLFNINPDRDTQENAVMPKMYDNMYKIHHLLLSCFELSYFSNSGTEYVFFEYFTCSNGWLFDNDCFTITYFSNGLLSVIMNRALSCNYIIQTKGETKDFKLDLNFLIKQSDSVFSMFIINHFFSGYLNSETGVFTVLDAMYLSDNRQNLIEYFSLYSAIFGHKEIKFVERTVPKRLHSCAFDTLTSQILCNLNPTAVQEGNNLPDLFEQTGQVLFEILFDFVIFLYTKQDKMSDYMNFSFKKKCQYIYCLKQHIIKTYNKNQRSYWDIESAIDAIGDPTGHSIEDYQVRIRFLFGCIVSFFYPNRTHEVDCCIRKFVDQCKNICEKHQNNLNDIVAGNVNLTYTKKEDTNVNLTYKKKEDTHYSTIKNFVFCFFVILIIFLCSFGTNYNSSKSDKLTHTNDDNIANEDEYIPD